MLTKKSLSKCLAVSAMMLAGSAAFAQQLTLPPSNEMTVGTYGDFNVYSLELNEKCLDAGDPRCIPSGPYPVQSSPGQIADYLLILQGGSTADNYPPLTGITGDNAFVPPQGANDPGDANATFLMGGNNGAEPTPDGFTGDRDGTWEVQLGSLLDYLTNPTGDIGDLVFLFDNNQQGAGENQFQYIFATASIRDAAGNVVNNQCYGLFGTGSFGNSNQASCANPNPTAPTFDANGITGPGDYVPLITDFCVDKVTGESYKIGLAGNDGDCTGAGDQSPSGNDGYYISNNLGNNNAEFAAFNQNLQDAFLALALSNPTYVLSVNIRLANLTDGPEQAWICSACGLDRTILIPEPGSLALAGLALAGLGLARRRRRD